MNEHAAFLAAILAAPADDLPRLVFADWLDERGDPRGEFIRIQVELARSAAPAAEGARLRRRERELLGNHWHGWWFPSAGEMNWSCEALYPLPPCPPPSVAFRRGFVERMTISWADWWDWHESIRAATPLREVRLTNWPGATDPDLAAGHRLKSALNEQFPGITFELAASHPRRLALPDPSAGFAAVGDAIRRSSPRRAGDI